MLLIRVFRCRFKLFPLMQNGFHILSGYKVYLVQSPLPRLLTD